MYSTFNVHRISKPAIPTTSQALAEPDPTQPRPPAHATGEKERPKPSSSRFGRLPSPTPDSSPQMPPSDEAVAFYHAVYSAVREIPPGKVTSYGHIARLIGTRKEPALILLFVFVFYLSSICICIVYVVYRRQNTTNTNTAQRPRQVGTCLKYLSQHSRGHFHSGNVPWQRVVNAKGGISPR